MRVAVSSVILVGKVILGIKLYDKRCSRNVLIHRDFCLSRLRYFQLQYNVCFMCNCSKQLFHIFIIKLKGLHRWLLVDSTQYVTLFIRNDHFNEYRFQFFWRSVCRLYDRFIRSGKKVRKYLSEAKKVLLFYFNFVKIFQVIIVTTYDVLWLIKKTV